MTRVVLVCQGIATEGRQIMNTQLRCNVAELFSTSVSRSCQSTHSIKHYQQDLPGIVSVIVKTEVTAASKNKSTNHDRYVPVATSTSLSRVVIFLDDRASNVLTSFESHVVEHRRRRQRLKRTTPSLKTFVVIDDKHKTVD